MQVDQQPAFIEEAAERPVLIEDQGTEGERRDDVRAGEPDAETACDQRAPSRRAHDERQHLRQRNRKATGNHCGADPDDRVRLPAQPRRDQESAGEQRQREPERTLRGQVVAQHHGQQVEGGSADRERQYAQCDEMNRQHRCRSERPACGNVPRSEGRGDGCGQPADRATAK